MIDTDVSQLYRLACQPGAYMEATWWQALGLESWRPAYLRWGSCRRAIDNAIVARRGFPMAPLVLTEADRALVRLAPVLSALMIALGLLALGRVDYLLLGRYRRILDAELGQGACDTLLMFCSRVTTEQIESVVSVHHDLIVPYTRSVGTKWLWQYLDSDDGHMNSWQVIKLLVPHPTANDIYVLPTSSALDWLYRLARMLNPAVDERLRTSCVWSTPIASVSKVDGNSNRFAENVMPVELHEI